MTAAVDTIKGARLPSGAFFVDAFRRVLLRAMRRCRANVAPSRESRPDSGLGFQVKVLKSFKRVPSFVERGVTFSDAEATHAIISAIFLW